MGNRIAISSDWMPDTRVKSSEDVPATESGILLTPDSQKELEKNKNEKLMENSDRFRIVQVGEDCSPIFKVGQEIMIEKAVNVLNGAQSIIENKHIVAFIIPERAIAGIY
jgi:hypothetical protein